MIKHIAANGTNASKVISYANIIKKIKASDLQIEIYSIVDFRLVQESDLSSKEAFVIESYPGEKILGLDGSGGEYHLLPDGRIIFLSSEGELYLLADDFEEFLAITTGLSSWQDALKYCQIDELGKAKKNWLAFEEEYNLRLDQDRPWRFMPEIYKMKTSNEARKRIKSAFSLPDISDPFTALYNMTRRPLDGLTVTYKGKNVKFSNYFMKQ